MLEIVATPLEPDAFAPFGEVIQKEGSQNFPINNGKCQRHHRLATAEATGTNASVIINIFAGQPYSLPHIVTMVERHPFGSQAFYPLGSNPWLVIVCEDHNGRPEKPRAFLATSDQGVNLYRNIWHGVLTPLLEPSDFLVIDREGEENNLEEFYFSEGEGFRVRIEEEILNTVC